MTLLRASILANIARLEQRDEWLPLKRKNVFPFASVRARYPSKPLDLTPLSEGTLLCPIFSELAKLQTLESLSVLSHTVAVEVCTQN
ncbi:hypothetical protein K0M31_004564 [Melipona bicolor]|uniref:Uncharacterized protein n=1 Tax=Melipona bicolor TaxID=60889 RepID=A0AA40KNH9_9HYME|nr:hypothetical protein K0M31_004564 [Melipona bicolor]